MMPPLPDAEWMLWCHNAYEDPYYSATGGYTDNQMHAYAATVAAPLAEALQMLYDETADYIRLNNLGGMDNQCMRLARAALAAHREQQ